MNTSLHNGSQNFPRGVGQKRRKREEEEKNSYENQTGLQVSTLATRSRSEPRCSLAPVSPATIPSWTNKKEVEIAKGSISFPGDSSGAATMQSSQPRGSVGERRGNMQASGKYRELCAA